MFDTIDREELEEKLERDENLTLLEVLGPEEYQRSHIKGAINIPLSEIGREAEEKLESDEEIVVYCANSDCQASPQAAKKLVNLGYNRVYDYAGGKQDWKEAGNPMIEEE